MDATDLRTGFRLGVWRVEPQESRLYGPTGTLVLEPEHMQLLVCLVEHHGEAVDRRTLRERAWPGRSRSDQLLRAGIRALRESLGGSPKDQAYIVTVSRGGFALIAHFEPVEAVPATQADSQHPEGRPVRRTLVGRLQTLIFELRRRSVFRVSGGYLLGIWIMLQVAEVTFEPLRLPEWWMTALTILAVIGLPIVATLAWSYEITPGGIVLDGAPEGVKLPRARRAVAPAIVAGVALMAAVTGVAWWRSIEMGGTEASPQVDATNPSIAVLPLVDMSPSGGNSYLGDGLSEELSMRLAQVPGLRVAARTSSFEFKDRNVDVRRIGQSLGVRHVLEGSVRRDGDNLRVTMQLIDSANGYHVWAGSYDRSWSDVISIQDEIARSVTEALRIVLVPEETSQETALAATLDVRAVDPYLAGLALLRQSGDMSRLKEAAKRFGEAIEIEPSFARAYAGLCRVGVRIYDRTRDPSDLYRAEHSCRRALDLDVALARQRHDRQREGRPPAGPEVVPKSRRAGAAGGPLFGSAPSALLQRVRRFLQTATGQRLFVQGLKPAGIIEIEGREAVREAVAQGLIRDLTPFIEADPNFQADDYYPGTLDAFRWANGTWALPTMVNYYLFFYDKDKLLESITIRGVSSEYVNFASYNAEQGRLISPSEVERRDDHVLGTRCTRREPGINEGFDFGGTHSTSAAAIAASSADGAGPRPAARARPASRRPSS